MPRIVADTSVIINGQLIAQVESGSVRDSGIIIPQAVVDELQSQASMKREQGFVGLEKMQRLASLSGTYGLQVVVQGEHPSADDIMLASGGRIDALVIDVARSSNATLYTSDRVQHMAAKAQGIRAVLLRDTTKNAPMEFLKFFDPQTMSVHLKENQKPMAKRGRPGAFQLTVLDDEPLSADYLKVISSQILDAAESSDQGTVEISRTGASVVQYLDYRVAITRPPFSESVEITIVHPTAKLTLEDYSISEKLMHRLADRAEGIVISGAPGSGKSTLASSLGNYYHHLGKIVKTFESPRDLQVDSGVTQYGKLDGTFENAADILLLVRPDYTVFDEIRRREDFGTFADLRMSGVGLVGVVHANSPLDAIQRFIGKIELGIIPNVLDTVIFILDGKIEKVYDLELKVKVPSGMTESDLARPVIEVRDFDDNTLEHEIYTFGEENVIVPVAGKSKKTGLQKLAEERIQDAFRMYDPGVQVELVSENRAKVYVEEHCISSIIGRGGSNIEDIQKHLNIHLDVTKREVGEAEAAGGLQFTLSESRGTVFLTVSKRYASMHADLHAGDQYLGPVRIGRRGQIKIPHHSDAARELAGLKSPDDIRLLLRDR